VQHHQHQHDSVNNDKHQETLPNTQLVKGGKNCGKQASKGMDRIVTKGRLEKGRL
jgi:hypothetical protein